MKFDPVDVIQHAMDAIPNTLEGVFTKRRVVAALKAYFDAIEDDIRHEALSQKETERTGRLLKRAWESGHGSGFNLGKGYTKTSEGCFKRFMAQINARVVLADGNQATTQSSGLDHGSAAQASTSSIISLPSEGKDEQDPSVR